MLNRASIPGFFVTGTDTGVGKTVVSAAVCDWFASRSIAVGVCKIAATGCDRLGDDLISSDATYLEHWAKSGHPPNVICPQRWEEPLAPAVAAERAGSPIDWAVVQATLDRIQSTSEVMVVEGVGGLLVPMDALYSVQDVIGWLGLPVIVVARAGLGTINHTLLTVNAVRAAGGVVAGVVINRYPSGGADIATETNPAAIEKWGNVKVLCRVPDEPFEPPAMPAAVRTAVGQVDWMDFGGMGAQPTASNQWVDVASNGAHGLGARATTSVPPEKPRRPFQQDRRQCQD